MLILASESPARKALLEQAGLRFRQVGTRVDERRIEEGIRARGSDAQAVAIALAYHKADEVALEHPGAVVIGADQTLALEGDLLHKPADRAEARRQLDRLNGRAHTLQAAVALVRDGQQLWSGCETATLRMRAFSPAERDWVLDREGDAILGSVGSYRLEGASITLFERIEGDYFTILGLPLLPLLAALRIHAPECFP